MVRTEKVREITQSGEQFPKGSESALYGSVQRKLGLSPVDGFWLRPGAGFAENHAGSLDEDSSLVEICVCGSAHLAPCSAAEKVGGGEFAGVAHAPVNAQFVAAGLRRRRRHEGPAGDKVTLGEGDCGRDGQGKLIVEAIRAAGGVDDDGRGHSLNVACGVDRGCAPAIPHRENNVGGKDGGAAIRIRLVAELSLSSGAEEEYGGGRRVGTNRVAEIDVCSEVGGGVGGRERPAGFRSGQEGVERPVGNNQNFIPWSYVEGFAVRIYGEVIRSVCGDGIVASGGATGFEADVVLPIGKLVGRPCLGGCDDKACRGNGSNFTAATCCAGEGQRQKRIGVCGSNRDVRPNGGGSDALREGLDR